MQTRGMRVLTLAAFAVITIGDAARATEYAQVLNADACEQGSGIYSGTAAGPVGLGNFWNKWIGDGLSQPAVLTNAQGQATAATIELTVPVIGRYGDLGAVVQVSGAAALNSGFKYVSGSDAFEFKVKALPASTNSNGKWDVYLYLNIDNGASASFTATSGAVSVSDKVGPASQTSWVEGDSFWVLRDLTPVNGSNITVNIKRTGGSNGFLWLNGVQLAEQKGNRPPVAYDQSVKVVQGVASSITLAATDPNNDAINYTVLTQPAHGSLSGTPPNLTYTSRGAYLGADSFTFRANDGQLNSNTGTVSIAVVAAYVRLINVDVVNPTYSGTAAGPSGQGSTWNSANGGAVGTTWSLNTALGNASGITLKLMSNYISQATLASAVSVTGAENLNRDFKYVQFGNANYNTFAYAFTNLATSVNGSGMWDIYLYVNTDAGQTGPFAAACGGVSISSTVTPQTVWSEGVSYWVLRNLTPSGGVLTLTVKPTTSVNSGYLWFNGMQLAEQKLPPTLPSGTVVLLR